MYSRKVALTVNSVRMAKAAHGRADPDGRGEITPGPDRQMAHCRGLVRLAGLVAGTAGLMGLAGLVGLRSGGIGGH